ncbi:hypothetical protein ATKI12_7282 [Kitasatospora sp. Ki12]
MGDGRGTVPGVVEALLVGGPHQAVADVVRARLRLVPEGARALAAAEASPEDPRARDRLSLAVEHLLASDQAFAGYLATTALGRPADPPTVHLRTDPGTVQLRTGPAGTPPKGPSTVQLRTGPPTTPPKGPSTVQLRVDPVEAGRAGPGARRAAERPGAGAGRAARRGGHAGRLAGAARTAVGDGHGRRRAMPAAGLLRAATRLCHSQFQRGRHPDGGVRGGHLRLGRGGRPGLRHHARPHRGRGLGGGGPPPDRRPERRPHPWRLLGGGAGAGRRCGAPGARRRAGGGRHRALAHRVRPAARRARPAGPGRPHPRRRREHPIDTLTVRAC